MSEFENLYNPIDVLITDSDTSEEADTDILQELGLSTRQIKAGTSVTYDIISREDLSSEIPWNCFVSAIVYVLQYRSTTFRNLVLSVTTENRMYRRISLTRKRLQAIDSNISKAFTSIVGLLEGCQYDELYEDYDSMRIINAYGTRPEEFRVLTSIFEIAYDTENTGGGHTIRQLQARYVVIRNAKPRYGHFDCFFDCIHEILGLVVPLDIAMIRKRIKAHELKEINKKHIRRFERCTGICVSVYQDALVDGELSTYYRSEKKTNKVVELVLLNAHYYVFRGLIQDINSERKKIDCNSAKTYMFYGLETYMHPNMFVAVPYAMSYCIVVDGFINESGAIVRDDNQEDFSHSIYKLFHRVLDRGTIILIGFNNSSFDDYILIDILCRYGRKLKGTLINRLLRVLQFHYDNILSKDMYMFLTTSLELAATSFACKCNKNYIDHRKIQQEAYKNTIDEWISNNRDEIINHSIAKVMTLQELYFKARNMFLSINCDMNMDSSITISQMSMRAFDKHNKRETSKRKMLILPDEYESFARKALVGGRCQVFRREEQRERSVQSIDVVSLYPYVMMNKKYPYIELAYKGGKWVNIDEDNIHSVDTFASDVIGIYRVIVEHQPYDTIVPMREKDGSLNWTPTCPFETYSDSISLTCLIRHGGRFTVIKGFVLTCQRDYIFKSFLGPIADMKMKQDEYRETSSTRYNPCLRECLKLLMNSLSGKMAQKPIDKRRVICNIGDDIDAFVKKYQTSASITNISPNNMWLLEAEINERDTKARSATIVAIMIYAYAREYMYENFISKISTKYIMDTDSLQFDTQELALIDKSLIGYKCGQARVELPEECHGIYAAKKIYANYIVKDDKESIVKLKFKGLSKDDKIIPHHMVQETTDMIDNKDYDALNKLWSTYDKALSIESLRILLHNGTIHTLCNQTHKALTPTASISYRFIIKSFPYKTHDHI